MNEVGGSESGTGLRAIKSSRSSDANFEYDDSEWDVGIGNLIIDLDADIEKNNEANRINNNSDISNITATSGTAAISGAGSTTPSSSPSSGNGNNSSNLSANSSPPTTAAGSSNPQMHIPLTSSSGSNSNNSGSSNSGSGNGKSSNKSSGGNATTSSSLPKGSGNNSSSSSDLSSVMEHSSVVDKGLKMKIKRTKTGTKSGADAKHEIVKSDVVGSSNGTTAGVGSSAGNSGYAGNKSISDSISAKNSHSSHKDKDKLLIKDGLLHDNSHESSSINNATSSNSKQDNSADHGGGGGGVGGKVKTPRKGSTKEKKVKNNNSNVGNSGNSKKDDKSNDSSSKSLSNSSGGNSSSGSSGTHAKDNKEFFSTTVNLNVPNVIPNSSSSAFVKATATIKVPTAPSSSASSILSSSSGSGLHVHSSGGESTTPSGANSRTQNLSATTNSSSSSSNSSTPWGTVSPSKGAEKGRLSPSVTNLSNASEKTTGNTYKKSRVFAAADKTASPPDNSTSHSGSSSGAAFRDAPSINSSTPTDLSTTSSNFIQGVAGNQSASGFGSPKDAGKIGRNASSISSTSTTTTQDVCIGTSVGTVTEPDCLGPCEPGTSVTLEGIVWHETESGVLVVNVTWRGKTYVGTLIDCTKNDWAPPRFCDSPTSDLEMRTPKNRGKRGRAQTATPVNEPVAADTRSANAKLRNGAKGRRGSNTATAFVAPASPVKPDTWPKRKTRGSENESQEDPNPKNAKRPKVSKDGDRKDRRSNSPAPDNEKSGPSSPQLIECPEPNCSKKYKHINGLRYHQSHAHSNNFVAAEDSDSNMSTASNTNASTAPEPSNNTDSTVEPMVIDNGPEVNDNGAVGTTSNSSTATNSSADDSLSAPSTPGKKSSGTLQSTSVPKVDDKVYDLSSDADLNSNKDSNSQISESSEPFSKSVKSVMAASKPLPQGKDATVTVNSNDQEAKLTPENLSKDSITPPLSTTTASSTPTTTVTTPTLIPRTPILTVPVVPYMSLQSRNLVHGHVVNVPRVETSLNSRENAENSPLKNSTNQGQVPVSKGAPWQPHAHSQSQPQSGLSGHSSHVMNTSPQSQSITVPLNIPMSIPGSGGKDKDKNASPDQIPLKKNKHKKKSKDKDKDREGKSKGDKDKQDGGNNKNLSVSMGSGGPSDYSRSTGIFHNSGLSSDSLGGRSKDMSDSDSSRKNSLENRDDPQSPAYSDISDANDSGPDNELNVGSAIVNVKDTSVKGLVIPGDIKKDPLNVPGVPGPPFQSFFNHGLHSPYLDSLNYARQNKEGPGVVDEPEKNRPVGPSKHPNLPPNSQPPPNPPINANDESRRSPKMDFHPKYPFPNYFSYPYSGHPHPYHPYSDHPTFGNPMAPENSYNAPGQNRLFPGMEEREKESVPVGLPGKSGKPTEKDDSPNIVQIKQEPVDRDEKREKERSQSSALSMNEEKNVEIKSEFGSDHSDRDPKLLPPYMTNSSSKHKEHKRNEDRDRHERRHESKDMNKPENMKSSRNSSSNNDKNKSSVEESEVKERKDEGSKPTMETTGPPPPPTASAYYLPQSYLGGNPFLPFDPYRQVCHPYMHPGQIPRFPPPVGPTPLPEDLSRPNPGPPGNPNKALDLLQHHAAQYYNSHKIHELQERALKSPSPQVAASQRGERDGPPSSASSPGVHSMPAGTSTSGSMPKPADLSKDAKPAIGLGPNSDNGRTPTQHHVHSHTHHHTHVGVGIGYPIIPAVPSQYSPHYGVLATPPSAPSVIPPFPSQKPS